MNDRRHRRPSRPEGTRARKLPGSRPASPNAWPTGSRLRSSSTPPVAPHPWPLDDRVWDVFRLDEDDSPEYPDEGDFWVEADPEE